MKTESFQTKYQVLYPLCDYQAYHTYCLTLFDQLSDSRVRNLGIVGSFGSGKSSLVETFCFALSHKEQKDEMQTTSPDDSRKKRAFKTKNIKRISLANFSAVEPNSSPDPVKAAEVEKAICFQLLSSVSENATPSSKIRVFFHRDVEKIWFWIFGCLFLFLTASCVLTWLGFLSEVFVSEKIDLIFVSLAFLVLTVFMGYRAKFFSSVSLSVKDFSASLENKAQAESPFDLFLDEILYFIRKTKTKIIFLEDIDRFQSIELLGDLRNLNFALNENDWISKRGGVAFVYVVGDQCLWKNDQDGILHAKFFDFILTLPPITNSYNNVDAFLSLPEIAKHLSPESLASISSFVLDERVVRCIKNDFLFYCTNNNCMLSVEADYSALFALCVYKNTRPEDYSKFIQGKPSILISYLTNNENPTGDPLFPALKNNFDLRYPCLQYVSFWKGDHFFKTPSDKAFVESVKSGNSYDHRSFLLSDPLLTFGLLTSSDLKKPTALNPYLLPVIISGCSSPNNIGTKARTFIDQFTFHSGNVDNPSAADQFLADLLDPNAEFRKYLEGADYAVGTFLSLCSCFYPWVAEEAGKVFTRHPDVNETFKYFFQGKLNFTYNKNSLSSLWNGSYMLDALSQEIKIHDLFRGLPDEITEAFLKCSPLKVRLLDFYGPDAVSKGLLLNNRLIPSSENLSIILSSKGKELELFDLFTEVFGLHDSVLTTFVTNNLLSIVTWISASNITSIRERPDALETILMAFAPHISDPSLKIVLSDYCDRLAPVLPDQTFSVFTVSQLITSSSLLVDLDTMEIIRESHPELSSLVINYLLSGSYPVPPKNTKVAIGSHGQKLLFDVAANCRPQNEASFDKLLNSIIVNWQYEMVPNSEVGARAFSSREMIKYSSSSLRELSRFFEAFKPYCSSFYRKVFEETDISFLTSDELAFLFFTSSNSAKNWNPNQKDFVRLVSLFTQSQLLDKNVVLTYARYFSLISLSPQIAGNAVSLCLEANKKSEALSIMSKNAFSLNPGFLAESITKYSNKLGAFLTKHQSVKIKTSSLFFPIAKALMNYCHFAIVEDPKSPETVTLS